MRPVRVMSALALPALLSLAACKSEPPAPAPLDDQAAVARATAAMDELQKTLGGRLQEALKAGPADAVTVCSAIAPALAREIGEKHRLELGRSSHRLRNPDNAPRPWLAEFLATTEPATLLPPKPVAVPISEQRVGVVRGIPTAPMCTTCHGPAEALAPELRARLDQLYPADRATGFAEGDLRGVFWAELAR